MDYQIWTKKYCPKTYQDFIGGTGIINQVKKWIEDFKNGINKEKALLFYGPSGTGKSALSYIALESSDYRIVEYNCNNITDIKDMREQVRKSLGYANILELFQGNMKPAGVIIDEIDNISNGISELINMLKSKEAIKSPIIFTCNNLGVKGLKSLRMHCLEIKFPKPNKYDMEQQIKKICELEKMNLDIDAHYLIIKNTQGDWRKLVSILQDLKLNYGYDNINIEKVNKSLLYLQNKDVDYQLSEAINRIFNKSMAVSECNNLFMMDCAMVPLYMQENYPKALLGRKNTNQELIEKLAKISYEMTQYDKISSYIYQTQDWRLTSYVGYYSVNKPNFIINHDNKKVAKYVGMSSSSLLNKISQNRRYIKAYNNYPISLKTNLPRWDLFILSEIVVYNLFQKKGNPRIVIKLLASLGFNFWNDDKDIFSLDSVNTFLSINPNKSKKLTAKLKTDLKNDYIEYLKSSFNTN